MKVALQIFAKWIGFIAESTILTFGSMVVGVAGDLLSWAVSVALYPIRAYKAYEELLNSSKKGGQSDGQE